MPISKSKIDHLNVDITTAFLEAYEGSQQELHNEITEVIPMKTRWLEAPIAGFIGQMREWIGPRIIETLSVDRIKFEISKFEKTMAVLVDDIEDDNIGVYKGKAMNLGVAAKEWRDVQVFKKLEENGKAYDGKPFFATDHPTELGNQSNYQDGVGPAWYLFDTTRGHKAMIFGERISPTLQPASEFTQQHLFFNDELIWGLRARGGANYGLWQLAYKSKGALNDANLEAAMIALSERRNDRGDKLGLRATLLVVPGSLQGDARRLLDRTIVGATENVYKGAVRWVIGDRLTGV